MKNGNLMEYVNAKLCSTLSDSNTQITGARINMKEQDQVTIFLLLNSATSATAVGGAMKQHDAASSGNSKALSTFNPYYHKIGAATVLTKVSPAVTTDTYDLLALVGDSAAVVAFTVRASDLDLANGYAWVSFDPADAGVTRVAAVFAIAHDCRLLPAYGQAI